MRVGWAIVLCPGGSGIAFDCIAPLWANPAAVDRTTMSADQKERTLAAKGFGDDKCGRLEP
jgi:predicted metalloprotease